MDSKFFNENNKTIENVSKRREKTETEQRDRTLKIRKGLAVSITAATMAAMSLVGYGFYKLGQKNPVKEPTQGPSVSTTCDINSASELILDKWADYEYLKYCDEVDKTGRPDAQETKDIMYESYYLPVKTAYTNYLDTENEVYKNQMRTNAKLLESELNSKGNIYHFYTSPFVYAVEQDGVVFIPYMDDIKNGVVPEEAQVINNDGSSVVYVPYGKEDNKSLGI